MNTTIAIIDDDPSVLDSLGLLLKQEGFQVHPFLDAESFLNGQDKEEIIISDVRMPNMSGIELLHRLHDKKSFQPVILLTGHGDIEMAVTAMKLGAYDFIEKPYSKEKILHSLKSALYHTRKKNITQGNLSELQQRYDALTDRQKETMKLLTEGFSNKEIANELHISPRTVEIHRTLVMERMKAESLSQLIRMGIDLKILKISEK